MTRVAVVFVVCALMVPSLAGAQSLADVAKQEEARRKAVKEPGKVYTNTDLRSDISKGQPPPSSAAATDKAPADGAKPAGDAKDASADKAKANDPLKDQAY